ncbi:hypothetical protein FP74_gp124 [Bacillus phage CAM003]|nr:hypothetical protein FP76_gp129 [Bacillus phage Evoli]YP_009037138.1 hypothetical protein FP74_gp124 [Bacillus phage CAM003]AHZ09672.1 hypothetical protein [Bacillus phage CAM003]AHZ09965.1 hypothetical protein [Bacillus phage Evoli]ASU01090.1 hypothetical protein ANTHONY_250 [Bacillus phage Anthony]
MSKTFEVYDDLVAIDVNEVIKVVIGTERNPVNYRYAKVIEKTTHTVTNNNRYGITFNGGTNVWNVTEEEMQQLFNVAENNNIKVGDDFVITELHPSLGDVGGTGRVVSVKRKPSNSVTLVDIYIEGRGNRYELCIGDLDKYIEVIKEAEETEMKTEKSPFNIVVQKFDYSERRLENVYVGADNDEANNIDASGNDYLIKQLWFDGMLMFELIRDNKAQTWRELKNYTTNVVKDLERTLTKAGELYERVYTVEQMRKETDGIVTGYPEFTADVRNVFGQAQRLRDCLESIRVAD